jgi:hypothetical protein
MTRQKIAHVIAQNQLDARNNLFVTRTVTLSHKQRLDDYLQELAATRATYNAKNRQALARITQKNLLKHYESALNNALDVACTAYVSNQLNEASYHQVHDVNHGDDFWVQC